MSGLVGAVDCSNLHRRYTGILSSRRRVLGRTSIPHQCPYPPIIEKRTEEMTMNGEWDGF